MNIFFFTNQFSYILTVCIRKVYLPNMNTSPRVSMPCQKEPNQFNYADNTSRKAIDHTTNQES